MLPSRDLFTVDCFPLMTLKWCYSLYKCSSLLGFVISDEGKKFYNIGHRSNNPFEDDDDDDETDSIYQTINYRKIPPNSAGGVEKWSTGYVEKRSTESSNVCDLEKSSDLRCFDCHLIQNGGNRVVSVYENLDDETEKTPKEKMPNRDFAGVGLLKLLFSLSLMFLPT